MSDRSMAILEQFGGVAAAGWMAFVLLYASYVLARRIVPAAEPAMRWTATGVCGLWLASAGFQILIHLEGFRLSIALGLSVPLFIGTHLLGLGVRECLEAWSAEMAAIPRVRGIPACIAAGIAIVLLTVVIRGVLVPVVAWDSMTYHALKAGLWVQGGGPIDLQAPGGWSIYASYPGGGEALQAWAMLPFHGDLLVGLVDGLQWLFLGVATLALAGELGLPKAAGRIGAIYVLLLPAAARAVGSLYVDIPLALALVAGTALAAHGVRSQRVPAVALSFAALGLAVGIKVFALPVAAVLPPVAILLIRRELRSARDLAWIAGGLVAATAVSAPWFAQTWQRTGYPFSPLPLEILGVTLGQANDAMRWYLDRPRIESSGIAAEIAAAARMFGIPGFAERAEPTLGVFTLVPVLLFIPGIIGLARKRWRAAVIVVVSSAPILLSFYGDGLQATRLVWAAVSGRYVLGAIAPIVLVAFAAGVPGGILRRLYAGLLATGAGLLFVVSDVAAWRPVETLPAVVAASVTVVLFIGARRVPDRYRRRVAVTAMILACFFPFAVRSYRASTRENALRESIVLHPSPRYFAAALDAIEESPSSHVIALTSGPARDADNWFAYPFLGQHLENILTYVPVTVDGTIHGFSRYDERTAAAEFGSWNTRLEARGVTDVLSFSPRSQELIWMERRPGVFRRLAGDGRNWGLYRIVRPERRGD